MKDILNGKMKDIMQGGIRCYAGRESDFTGAINLCIGEPDFDTPKCIVEAGYKAMLDGKTHYTENAGLEQLRYEISGYVKKFGIDADYKTEILVTCGAMGSLAQIFLAIIDPGDEVIISDPQWLNYVSQIKLSGGVPISVAVSEKDGFSLKAAEIEKKLSCKTKAILINSPSNPTGGVIAKEDLSEIAKLAVEHDLYVISDEIYCELVYDDTKHYSIAAFPGMKERTIVVNGFSKAFAMTGWRLGYTVGPEKLISKMCALQENLNSCASSISQYAGIYALQTMSSVNEMVRTYDKRRRIVVDGLNNIEGVSCAVPKGAFYAFPNISCFGISAKEFAEKVIDNTHVLTVPGSCFGECGEGFLRISYASSEEKLLEAIRRIKEYTIKLPRRI